ncbi:MAG: hypothetical protein KY454_07215 [Actinobacteria bacterium]|nr:hypothetical protein [Actinomycetota bacterium]MBW3649527.1 hypothetical protein [Actinomycetota bacterium]
MKRQVATVVFVLGWLGTGAPAGASLVPGNWVCVVAYPSNVGVCIGP